MPWGTIESMLSQKTGSSPSEAFQSFVKYRSLLWQLTKREVLGRYRDSVLGLAWSLVHPLMMLTVYTLVFRFVFKSQWSTENQSSIDFALLLFAGLIAYWSFSECISRAPNLIKGNVNYVKKVMFPLELLPLVSLAASLFHMGVSVIVLLLFYGLQHLSLNWTVIVFPLLVVPLALFALGTSWFLASVGVFVRDIGQVIGVLTNILLFMSPVFYPLSALPVSFQPFMYLNPLTFQVEQMREVLILGKPLAWGGLGIYFLCSIVTAWVGLWWFQKTKKGFADVL
jgi:lipopolysaccharide transport system permease protein